MNSLSTWKLKRGTSNGIAFQFDRLKITSSENILFTQNIITDNGNFESIKLSEILIHSFLLKSVRENALLYINITKQPTLICEEQTGGCMLFGSAIRGKNAKHWRI